VGLADLATVDAEAAARLGALLGGAGGGLGLAALRTIRGSTAGRHGAP
jgi:hypothetical protein